MACGPPKYGTRTPHFMPYGPFLLGVGVFNLCAKKTLIFLSLLFWISLFFSSQGISLLFWAFFPFFPGILGVRHGEKILAFLGGFPCFFHKKQGKEDQGKVARDKAAHQVGCMLVWLYRAIWWLCALPLGTKSLHSKFRWAFKMHVIGKIN